jgi:hypothetical protein
MSATAVPLKDPSTTTLGPEYRAAQMFSSWMAHPITLIRYLCDHPEAWDRRFQQYLVGEPGPAWFSASLERPKLFGLSLTPSCQFTEWQGVAGARNV